jgi:hypothetical protein
MSAQQQLPKAKFLSPHSSRHSDYTTQFFLVKRREFRKAYLLTPIIMESLTSDLTRSSSQEGLCDENGDTIWSQWAQRMKKDMYIFENAFKRRNIVLPDATIDLDRIQGWIGECRTCHGESCNNRYSSALAQHCGDLILVDVIDGCIVDLPNTTAFVALSYVWGTTAMPKLRRSNYDKLKRPGELFAHSIDGIRVPQIILDAMHLLRKLNERFLWVDSLCVMQDMSTEDMDKTLQAMARIYASAEFTIVAAGGSDADHGLPGIGGPSRPRVPTNAMHDPYSIMVRPAYPWDSKWASRGWTFQESAFSRRLLVFDSLVSWVCGRCVWQEEVGDNFRYPKAWPNERPHSGIPMGVIELVTPYPDLLCWGSLMKRFSSRTLTHENDFTRAFAGATSVMGSMFPGGFIHGLPKFFFDIALLWQPGSELSQRPEGPSWSWTGWKGDIECCRHWERFNPVVYRSLNVWSLDASAAVLKSVAIYQGKPSIGTTLVDIPDLNKFYDYQALRKQPDDLLPAGWKRTEHHKGADYTHPAIGGGLFSTCKYPVPLSLNAATSCSTLTYTPSYLICTAPIATLSISKQGVDPEIEPLNLTILLENIIVGLLIANKKHQEMSQTGERLPCELVAISEAEIEVTSEQPCLNYSFPRYHPGYGRRSDGRSTDSQTAQHAAYYNVLWIHWENDVAYRKGIGAVDKEAWDSIGAEVRTFKLG